MVVQRACYVNCGLPDDQCACYRDNKPPLLYDPMPRQDLRVGPDTITLPRAEVEALMEAAEITLAAIMRLQDDWGDYDPEGIHWNRITAFAATFAEGDEHDAVRMRKALTALQERMK